MLLPSTASNPASMIAQALTMYKSLVNQGPKSDHQETSAVEGDWEDIGEKEISEGSKNQSGSTTFETEKPVFSLQSRTKEP